MSNKARKGRETGKETLIQLSASLNAEFGRGFSVDNLSRLPSFTYCGETASTQFPGKEKVGRKGVRKKRCQEGTFFGKGS